MAAALSLRSLAMLVRIRRRERRGGKSFRLMVTLVDDGCIHFELVFLRQRLVDEDRLLLLRDSQSPFRT